MNTPKKRKYRLRDLDIDRVDLVDKGANQHAHIVIAKAQTPLDRDAFVMEVRSKKRKRKGGSAFPEQVAASVGRAGSPVAPIGKHAQHNQDDHGNWARGGSSGDGSDTDGGGPKTKSGHRPLSTIASEIRRDWGSKVNYAAKPYLSAMASLTDITDRYYQDDAESVVAYFLSNATSWRGETAKRVKAELRAILSGKISKAAPITKEKPMPMDPGTTPPASAPAPALRRDDSTKNGENPRDKLAEFMRARAAAKEQETPTPEAMPGAAPAPTPGAPAVPGMPPAPGAAPGAPPGAAPRPAPMAGAAPGAVPGQAAPPAPAAPVAPRPQIPATSGALAEMLAQRQPQPQAQARPMVPGMPPAAAAAPGTPPPPQRKPAPYPPQ
jgi:hypothetical protein